MQSVFTAFIYSLLLLLLLTQGLTVFSVTTGDINNNTKLI